MRNPPACPGLRTSRSMFVGAPFSPVSTWRHSLATQDATSEVWVVTLVGPIVPRGPREPWPLASSAASSCLPGNCCVRIGAAVSALPETPRRVAVLAGRARPALCSAQCLARSSCVATRRLGPGPSSGAQGFPGPARRCSPPRRAMPASSAVHVLQLLRELLAFVLLSYTVLVGALLLAGWTTYFLVLK
ncbi:hypothetical protein J0S82_003890 [Galemys pyrenaicus]|uniref:Uncharacterized protein n=2 Tax=Boreoeutheria TaxID=1437010 RepID=A0A8J6A3Z5_GALPY|nr:hypothetical protein J0S82_003890 [Galemys pyrenaicus]